MKDSFFLPEDTLLGKLTIDEIYHFYDFPRLFTCVNKTGTKYLVLSTFDNDKCCEWLYLPISEKRHSELLNGDITIREAFKSPEDGRLYPVIIKSIDFHAFDARPENIPLSELPDEKLKLKEVS